MSSSSSAPAPVGNPGAEGSPAAGSETTPGGNDSAPPLDAPPVDVDRSPLRANWILWTLIGVEAVANLNLAIANVALPEIGLAFKATQTGVNLASVAFSLGLAGTVLYLGAVGDRYGRKMLLLAGLGLMIPASLVAAWAPNLGILVAARLIGGVAAGMAYPTTLALITALWSGKPRTRSIALWSAVGGSMIALALVLGGWLLEVAWWGSVFVITAPLALVAFVLALVIIPSHVNETTEVVDHFGGVLSVVGVIALVLAINFAPVAGEATLAFSAGGVALVALIGFFWRQRRAPNPLFDLSLAARPTFWVAAVAGIIVFGSLMGALFVGEQLLQNVLGYSTIDSGLAILPAAVGMVIAAPRSARMIDRFGSRATLLAGYAFCLASFVIMITLWKATSGFLVVGVAMLVVGIGVGLAGTPASHSLTGSVPVRRAGMASATADLQRDLGASIMQSIMGVILTAGYTLSATSQIDASHHPTSAQVADTLENSYFEATSVAHSYPKDASAIVAGAKTAFLAGADWSYLAGALCIVIGALLVGTVFPRKARETELLASYHAKDA